MRRFCSNRPRLVPIPMPRSDGANSSLSSSAVVGIDDVAFRLVDQLDRATNSSVHALQHGERDLLARSSRRSRWARMAGMVSWSSSEEAISWTRACNREYPGSALIDERSAQTPGFIRGVSASSPCSTPPAATHSRPCASWDTATREWRGSVRNRLLWMLLAETGLFGWAKLWGCSTGTGTPDAATPRSPRSSLATIRTGWVPRAATGGCMSPTSWTASTASMSGGCARAAPIWSPPI
jgi:hypothetical protein